MDNTNGPESDRFADRFSKDPVPGRVPASQVRVGDAERNESASQLQAHFAAGRLTWDELDERLAQAWAARTAGDLAVLFRDLPGNQAEPRADDRRPQWRPAPTRKSQTRPFRFHPAFGILIALLIAASVLTRGLALIPVVWLLMVSGLARHRLDSQHPHHSHHRGRA